MKELLGLTPRPRIVTACAGAGFGLAKTLLETPGASEYLVGCYLPYDGRETDDYLGFHPEQYVSEETAIHIAIESYMRAALRAEPDDNPIGLGLTASIASLKEHRGAHRVCFAAMSDHCTLVAEVTLEKDVGREARRLNDDTCSGLAASMLLDAAMRTTTNEARAFRDAFLSRPFFATGPGERRRVEPHAGILFPGNFDPLHYGHEAIADRVTRQTGEPVILCVNGSPPHKPRLSVQDMARRAAVMRSKFYPALFSDDDPLYIDKARRYPGRIFVIGADALTRMLDQKWGHEVVPMLEEFAALGTRFLVAPRHINGKLTRLRDINQYDFGALFAEIEGPLHHNVSSTELREQARAAKDPS